MKKMLFIYNPKAGKAQIRNKLADILDVFTRGGYEITIYPTQKREDAMEKTMTRDRDYDIVVCSGGDGTLDEVVTGMIRSGFRTPIGYIPAGSTNDFGGSLGLPKNMDGTLGFRAEATYRFAEDLKTVYPGEIIYWDERLSTVGAARFLNETNTRGNNRKKVIDTVSACIILEGYLNRIN